MTDRDDEDTFEPGARGGTDPGSVPVVPEDEEVAEREGLAAHVGQHVPRDAAAGGPGYTTAEDPDEIP